MPPSSRRSVRSRRRCGDAATALPRRAAVGEGPLGAAQPGELLLGAPTTTMERTTLRRAWRAVSKSGTPFSHARLAAEGTTLTYRGVPSAAAGRVGPVGRCGALLPGALGGGEAAAEDPLLPSFARGLAAGVVDVSAGRCSSRPRTIGADGSIAGERCGRHLRAAHLAGPPRSAGRRRLRRRASTWLAHGRAVLAGALPPSADADAARPRVGSPSSALPVPAGRRRRRGGAADAGAHAAAAAAAWQPALYLAHSRARRRRRSLRSVSSRRRVATMWWWARRPSSRGVARGGGGGGPAVYRSLTSVGGAAAGGREPPAAEDAATTRRRPTRRRRRRSRRGGEAATAAMSRVDAVVAQRQARRDARARRQAGALEVEADAEVEEAEAEAEAAEAALAAKKAETEAAEEAVAAAKAKTEAAEEAAATAARQGARRFPAARDRRRRAQRASAHVGRAATAAPRRRRPSGRPYPEFNPDHPPFPSSSSACRGVAAEEGEDVGASARRCSRSWASPPASAPSTRRRSPSGPRERRRAAATAEAPRRGRRWLRRIFGRGRRSARETRHSM